MYFCVLKKSCVNIRKKKMVEREASLLFFADLKGMVAGVGKRKHNINALRNLGVSGWNFTD